MFGILSRATYFTTIIVWILCVYPIAYLLVTGDYSGPQNFYGLQEDDDLVAVVINVRDTLLGH